MPFVRHTPPTSKIEMQSMASLVNTPSSSQLQVPASLTVPSTLPLLPPGGAPLPGTSKEDSSQFPAEDSIAARTRSKTKDGLASGLFTEGESVSTSILSSSVPFVSVAGTSGLGAVAGELAALTDQWGTLEEEWTAMERQMVERNQRRALMAQRILELQKQQAITTGVRPKETLMQEIAAQGNSKFSSAGQLVSSNVSTLVGVQSSSRPIMHTGISCQPLVGLQNVQSQVTPLTSQVPMVPAASGSNGLFTQVNQGQGRVPVFGQGSQGYQPVGLVSWPITSSVGGLGGQNVDFAQHTQARQAQQSLHNIQHSATVPATNEQRLQEINAQIEQLQQQALQIQHAQNAIEERDPVRQNLVHAFDRQSVVHSRGPTPFPSMEVPSPVDQHLNPSALSFNSSRPFKMEKPLLIFDGTKGPEDFDKFTRAFEFYVNSRGAQDLAVKLVETWLEKTPLQVYQQFIRDKPRGTFEELKTALGRLFGRPLDKRRAMHKLASLDWEPGQDLVDLATTIRDLHYLAHPNVSPEDRDGYAGDTFMRCLPKEWQIKLREKGGGDLADYLEMALELQNTEKHRKELEGRRSGFKGSNAMYKVETAPAKSEGQKPKWIPGKPKMEQDQKGDNRPRP